MEQSLLLEPRLELAQLRQYSPFPAIHRGGERAVRPLAGNGRHVAPEHAADAGGVERLQLRALRAPHGAPGGDDPDAGDAEAEEDAGGPAVLGEALGDVGLRRARRPRDGADLDVGDGGRLEAREEVVEDEVRVRVPGARLGGEEARAVEPREEGVPDAGRDGGVGGEGLVEGALLLPAVPGLERLVEEVDEPAELVDGGAVACDLALGRAEVRRPSPTWRGREEGAAL